MEISGGSQDRIGGGKATAIGDLLDEEVARAARAVAAAHQQCMAVHVVDGPRDSAYTEAAERRFAALETLVATPAESVIGLETKRDALAELEVWIGREDPEFCGLVIQLAHEAVALLRRHTEATLGNDGHATNGHSGAGRWLIGIAASVPSFFVDRFGLS